jgi:hypothetical protein
MRRRACVPDAVPVYAEPYRTPVTITFMCVYRSPRSRRMSSRLLGTSSPRERGPDGPLRWCYLPFFGLLTMPFMDFGGWPPEAEAGFMEPGISFPDFGPLPPFALPFMALPLHVQRTNG